MELSGVFPWSSNQTFLVTVSDGNSKILAVYKPIRGERPLWDFPEGTLALREVAAYIVSEALGWHLVPPTVLRGGPHGPGAVQLYIDADSQQNYFTFGAWHPQTSQRIALFDAVVNNADRKAGHCLVDREGRIWAIDHGICFSVEPKLRSVIWNFAGQPIPPGLRRDLQAFSKKLARKGALQRALARLLSPPEIEALARRVDDLVASERFPTPGRERHYPWPLV